MNFKIITTQRNSAVWLPECINSLASQLGESFKFMDEVLYSYNSENPMSEWRDDPKRSSRVHQHVLARPPKVPHV